jgi:DNA-binding NarL/FixJ family response regulator
VVAAAEGDGTTASRHLENAIELFVESGAPFDAEHARLTLADVLAGTGREQDAARQAAAALRGSDQLGAAGQSARARALLGRLGHVSGVRGRGQLTSRQAEVLRLAAEGLDNRQIAERLGVGEGTIQRHVRNACGTLGCRSRAAALEAAAGLGLL